jgi:Fungal specific transcription factor domain/Fungal Zn(2)-Cys(6) binuclear cluster domain
MDTLAPHKRPRPTSPTSTSQESVDSTSTRITPGGSGQGNSSASSAFRNVSACNRCRLRKNKCDQNLPACTSCEKAGVKCVGYDPITKREIPRAYVYYLESRVAYLEGLLSNNNIAFAPSDDFDAGTRAGTQSRDRSVSPLSPVNDRMRSTPPSRPGTNDKQKEEADRLNKLVSNIGMVTVQGASDPRYLGSTSGISFARVVFAAVRSSISGSTSDRAGPRPGRPPPQVAASGASGGNSTNFRDSFFGLQSKPHFKKAPFPDRELGAKLVKLYFEHANPQMPILHRGEFLSLINRTYQNEDEKRSPRELYMLNIVFAIGAGTIMEDPGTKHDDDDDDEEDDTTSPKSKRFKQGLSKKQAQPEQYHASAMVHLEYFLTSSPAADRPEGFGGSLEELQAVLLLASFALLRPVAPGLWYIVGVAMRLAVDLGLHHEDGNHVEEGGPPIRTANGHRPSVVDAREKGRREWIRDLRRRLWWCVYSFDRLVSTCVGRPFGITDQVVTTEFPSLLDDNYITTSGFTAGVGHDNEPSYKRVSHHYFRFRLLQSEILQVLQYRSTKHAREMGRNRNNQFMHTHLRSPFLEPHDNNFKRWRRDIDRRLWEWKESAPSQKETQVKFSVYFLELNYNQAVIMLYRQSLHVPPELDGEISPSSEIESPLERTAEDEEDDEEVFIKVAEAGQQVLKLYMLLHKEHVVNYTFLATHHLFMAGIAFLYAVWHSGSVRSMLVSFRVLLLDHADPRDCRRCRLHCTRRDNGPARTSRQMSAGRGMPGRIRPHGQSHGAYGVVYIRLRHTALFTSEQPAA